MRSSNRSRVLRCCKFLFHRAVHEACRSQRPLLIRFAEGSYYQRLGICVPHVKSAGTTDQDCHAFLRNLGDKAYWYPHNPFFPFIDAVMACDAFRPANAKPERLLAYIQVTTSAQKRFKPVCLHQLNATVAENPNLRRLPSRLFVVAHPDTTAFQLKDAPKPAAIRALVGCFDLEQLVAHAGQAQSPAEPMTTKSEAQ